MTISVFAANNNNNLFVNNKNIAGNDQKTQTANNGKSIFAGGFNMQENTIEIKRKLAQKRAMKILTDTFASDSKIDDSIDGLHAQKEQLQKEILEDKKVVKEVQEQRNQLMKDYNIDSKENKDLELELDELNEREEVYTQRFSQKEAAAKAISGAISDIQIERLKHHEMVDSSKQADEIMDQANKELIGSLYDEAKDHIDEKMEEEQKKAEEKSEKKEEEEKKKAERKKEQLELEKQIAETKQNAEQVANAEPEKETVPSSPIVTRDISDVQDITIENPNGDLNETNIDRELAKILDELKLLTEDIKGYKIDANI